MRTTQDSPHGTLMTAEDVEALLGVDKSTVYRMAQDGRLPAIKVGRQWRFPAEPIRSLLTTVTSAPAAPTPSAPAPAPQGALTPEDATAVQPVIDLVSELLGVMMVVTDMDGNPTTGVANPCTWFAERQDDPQVLEDCVNDWRAFANEQAFQPAFRQGPHGFECARALIRDGNQLVGMVLAGGVAPGDWPVDAERDVTDGFYHLTASDRAVLLSALPRVAATISRVARQPDTARSE